MSAYFHVFDISSAGMQVERQRLEISALNIANAHSSRGPNGTLFQPLRVVAKASMGSFEESLLAGTGLEAAPRHEALPSGVQPRLVYDPGHPHADERGYVAMPGVNPLVEMTQIMTAVRAYEANVKAIEAARAMAVRALEIGNG